MQMEYIRYSDISSGEWNQYIDEISGITFNYTSERISFNLEYSRNIIVNETFLALDNKKPVAAAEIYIEKYSNGLQISWNGSYCNAPYIDNRLDYRVQENMARKLMAHIDEIAGKNQCKKIMLKEDPLGNPEQSLTFYNYNFLLKYGYIDESGMTQLIDLRQSKDKLYSDVRKGHKRHINRGKIYDIKIYDQHNVTDEMIELYKAIYEKDAGKVTRNSELYRYYLEFVKNGKGLLAFGRINEQEVGVVIVTVYKNTAYYSSYGELEEELNHVPIGHILHWEIINYLKEHGIEFYEMGEQVFGKTHYSDPDEKLINISNFKRRFGGYTVPFWRGVKKYK